MSFLTYFDLVENLIVSSYGGPQDAEQRDIRTAVQRAYAELTTVKEWSYYQTHGRIVTQTPYSTGSVSYSTSTNTLTLSGGVWPAWAEYGSIAIGRLKANVRKRVSDTSLLLDPTVTFATNLSGQSYVLYRSQYPLPSDFRNMDEPSNEFNWWSGLYLSPDEAMKLERVGNRSGRPWHWTIVKDPDSSGYVLTLVGYPASTETLDFTYRRYARPLRWSGHESAARLELASSSGDTVIAVAPQVFDSSMVGSVLRVGTAVAYPGAIESLTPYSAEHLITGLDEAYAAVPNDTAIVTPAPSISSKNCIVTDPADVGRHMQTVLFSCSEYWLTRIRGGKADQAFSTYQRDLRLAMEQDQLAPLSGRSREIWHDGGWRSPLKPDEGA